MNKKALRTTINSALAAGRRALSAPEAQQLCDAYGIPTPKQGLATTAADAAKLAARFGFPVVLKIVSDDILHKTEAGGVIVGLGKCSRCPARFRSTRQERQTLQEKRGHSGCPGAADAERRPGSHGRRRDRPELRQNDRLRHRRHIGRSDEGHHLSHGAGRARKTRCRCSTAIGAAEVLRGVRGAKGVDRAALADIIDKVSKLVNDFPEIHEVDLNPIFATEKGARAVDVRIVIGD